MVPVFAAAEIQSNESRRLRQFQCWDGTAGQVDDSVTIVHEYQPDKKYPKMNRSHRFPTVSAAGCADRKLLGTAGTHFLTGGAITKAQNATRRRFC